MKKINKLILVIVIALPLVSMTILNEKLVVKKILENKVSIKIPVSFKELSKKERINNFQRGYTPVAAFSDKTETVFVVFNQPAMKPATQESIDLYKDKYVELNDYFANCIDSGIVKNNNKKVGFINVDGLKLKQKPIYLAMSFTDAYGRILECKFYCPANKKEQWKDIANEIIKSFTVN